MNKADSKTAATTAWHTESVEPLLERLGTRGEGLTSVAAEERLREHGPNELK